MLPTHEEVKVKKINLRQMSERYVNEPVVVEAPVTIYLNGKRTVTLLSLPLQLKELCVGWLLDQGIIESIDELTDVQVEENRVKTVCSGEVENRLKARKAKIANFLFESGAEHSSFRIDQLIEPFVDSDYRIKAEKIPRLINVLDERSTLFKSTGGTHSAAIFHNEKLIAFAEDVGRHNAIDKVVGESADKRVDFSRCIVTSTGRQTANMVLKAARLGIPILASIAGPILSGVDAAKRTGVTLICFVRGHRMNVYSSYERIILNKDS